MWWDGSDYERVYLFCFGRFWVSVVFGASAFVKKICIWRVLLESNIGILDCNSDNNCCWFKGIGLSCDVGIYLQPVAGGA